MTEKQEIPNVKKLYRDKVAQELHKRFAYRNVMEIPKLDKIVVNMGVGEAINEAKVLEAASRDLGIITGQRPAVTRARKAIAGFKLRAGLPVGCRVTLRGDRMYEFFDRLVNAAIPRIRDFRGLSSKSFDGRGNYTFGVKEHIIFPEIDYDKIEKIRGLQVTIVTSAKRDDDARLLLKLMGMPFAGD